MVSSADYQKYIESMAHRVAMTDDEDEVCELLEQVWQDAWDTAIEEARDDAQRH